MAKQSEPACKWTDAQLDEMRNVGDPLADEVVADLFASTDADTAWQKMMCLDIVKDPKTLTGDLPLALKRFLQDTDKILEKFQREENPSRAGRLDRLYRRCRPEVYFILGLYSLPASYAARKGVHVLFETGFVEKRPNLRVRQTAKMVENVMKLKGLEPGEPGMRSVQKVRLIHAAIRYLILHDKQKKWPADFGVPINQEDMAGTLLVFSFLIIDGLRKLGIWVRRQDKQHFMDTWAVIGRLMGVREELIPGSVKEAKALSKLIQKRQIEVGDEGLQMTHALLTMFEETLPGGFFRPWPAALMRFFLPTNVADGFEIRRNIFLAILLRLLTIFNLFLQLFPDAFKRYLSLIRRFGDLVVRAFVATPAPYSLPMSLKGGAEKLPWYPGDAPCREAVTSSEGARL